MKPPHQSSESHSKAEIKFVIKNEYAQIIPAVKAVKTAKQNLSKAKMPIQHTNKI
ncbi:hypothetical protein BSPWISOXPB_10017 [uncultured Gammaproteobacteria bacterium]|nr:hypothetical protein BSPWISOXPB_10017 [uncultured Gammaproteobacteria bacterium]